MAGNLPGEPRLDGAPVALHFLLQAEDRIRDFPVTEVQTCALPILHRARLRGVPARHWCARRYPAPLGLVRRESARAGNSPGFDVVTGRRPPHAWFAAARSVPRGDVTAILLVVAAVLLVVVPTLTPTAGESGTSFFCVFCGSLGGLDFSLNLLLFMPLGAAMWNATGSWRHGVVAGFLLSVAIEALQYRVVAGRYTSMGDVLANTLGSWIGVWIATGSQRAWNATASTARRIATVAGIATALVVCGSALLLQPSRTRYPQWLQWSPVKKGDRKSVV